MLLIWGSKSREKKIEEGVFSCQNPECADQENHYHLKYSRR